MEALNLLAKHIVALYGDTDTESDEVISIRLHDKDNGKIWIVLLN